MNNKKLKVLSLFDGISIAQQAFKDLGYKVEYYASEIDKYAIQITKNNFPNTTQLGDVCKIGKELPYPKELLNSGCDLVIFGSPCTDLSIAKKNRQGLKGEASSLFFEAVRIIKDIKPSYFIMENVDSMSRESREIITKTLYDIEPVMINASKLSSQQRKRLFWVGKLVGNKYEKISIPQPADKKIYIKDILENKETVKEKKYYLTIPVKDFSCVLKDKPVRISSIGKGGQGDRIYSIFGKSVCLSANGGGRGAKTGLYLMKENEITKEKEYSRILTPLECERLQSVPDFFTKKGINEKGEEVTISNAQRYKVLGNGFNCSVIKHILEQIL